MRNTILPLIALLTSGACSPPVGSPPRLRAHYVFNETQRSEVPVLRDCALGQIGQFGFSLSRNQPIEPEAFFAIAEPTTSVVGEARTDRLFVRIVPLQALDGPLTVYASGSSSVGNRDSEGSSVRGKRAIDAIATHCRTVAEIKP